MADELLSVRNLSKHFTGRRWVLRAVDNVSYSIQAGETLGLIGESGCGKTPLSRLVLLAQPATSGSIRYAGREVLGLPARELAEFRRCVQAVFQDPFSSLSPRMRIGDIISEPLDTHEALSRAKTKERVAELLELVGLNAAMARRFPHEFSGGQRQRIAIARALSTNARLIVLDEPVSALDASIRAHIINLLKDLQNRLGVAYLFIAHDLATVAYISDRIAVMYLGRIVEMGPSRGLARQPLHPYTRALFAASLPTHPDEPRADVPPGEVPSAMHPPTGCAYHPRCPLAVPHCKVERPELREVAPGHQVACHLVS